MAADEQTLLRANAKCLCGIRNLQERVTTRARATVVVEPPVEVVEIVHDTTAIIETLIPEVEGWSRKLHLKTNAIGLGMAIANVAAEVDLAKHWSFTLPVAIGCRKRMTDSSVGYISAWHITILLLMAITATKSITGKRLPSVVV